MIDDMGLVFAFVEDGTLRVYGSPDDAIRQFEGVDVESGVVRFYDDSGVYLAPKFTKPNLSGTILGVVGWVQSGSYELVANPHANEDSFALALYETSVLEPNAWFMSLAHVRQVLSAKGVAVEYQPS
jgi:hypothetical protein